MSVLTTEQLRNIGIGQTIMADASYREAQSIRTLANRLKGFDEYKKKGIRIKVHFKENEGKIYVSKVKTL